MSTFKTIFSGRLEFGTDRSYSQVTQLFEHRVANYYRGDVIIRPEEVFNESSYSIDIPRHLSHATEKSWRNTLNLLEYLAQFAVAGNLQAWMTEEGKVLESKLIEPKGDKVAIQSYLKGRELVQVEGMESEAKKALSRAIDKFERHALAYERRGKVNFLLKNLDDAFYDFSKSIDINPNNPEPYQGRAKTHMARKNFAAAITDLEFAIKSSIPHQPIFWYARHLKAQCHLQLAQYEQAALELKLFTRRQFTPDNPNYLFRKKAFADYGKALLELGNYGEAIQAFDKAISIEVGGEVSPSKAEQLLYRGIARQKAGQSDFVNDWKEAAGLGSKKAEELLETID